MQRKQSFFSVLRDKGYYIALGVCALAVVISGWLYYRQADKVTPVSPNPDELPVLVMPEPSDMEAIATKPAKHDTPVAVLDTLPAVDATDAPAPAQLSLSTVKPVDGDVSLGYSMDHLSYNETTRDWRTHAGMDIAAPVGSQVRAAADGTVRAVYEDDLLGQTVTVEHAGGYVTHYSNLDAQVEVKAGDQVTAGTVLGRVGSTALLETGSAPHLHFAVYKNNVPQDPEEFLAA